MFDGFRPSTKEDWIKKANQETQKLESISFPHKFNLDGLNLAAINTSEPATSDTETQRFTLAEDSLPLISLYLVDRPESVSPDYLDELGLEDVFISLAQFKDFVKKISTTSLKSIAVSYNYSDWSAISNVYNSYESQDELNIIFYDATTVDPNLGYSKEQILQLASQIDNATENVRWLGVRGDIIGNKGGTVVQELAAALSLMVNLWDKLTDQGLSLKKVVSQTEQALSLSGEFYIDLVKFRAARQLLYYVLDAYQLESPNPFQVRLRAVSGTTNKALFDPDTNLMRNTVEALAATSGEANIITLRPHDFRYRKPTSFGERMATNIQHLLRHEGQLHLVQNPSDGSYFFDSAVDQLTTKAWRLFKKIEDKGGYYHSEHLSLPDLFARIRKEREQELLHQKRVIVGVTHYVNPLEKIAAEAVSQSEDIHFLGNRWESIRLKLGALAQEEQPAIAVLAQNPSNNLQVSQKITFVTKLIISIGLSPIIEYSIDEILDKAQLDVLVFCGDEAWYEENVLTFASLPSLASVHKVAVGKCLLLDTLRKNEKIDVVMNLEGDVSSFFAIIESLI